jgi:hypothetical protein
MPYPSHSPWPDYTLWSSSLCNFLQIHSSWVKIFLQAFCFRISVTFFFQDKRPYFTPIQNRQQNYWLAHSDLQTAKGFSGRQVGLEIACSGTWRTAAEFEAGCKLFFGSRRACVVRWRRNVYNTISRSHITTDGQSASSSWCLAPFRAGDQMLHLFEWQLLSLFFM